MPPPTRARSKSSRCSDCSKDKAIVVIDGKQRVLEAGETSPEGVKLISANSEEAVMEVGGETATYRLGSHIATTFAKPTEGPAVQIWPDRAGMYNVIGNINSYPVTFLVDTGATLIAMNRNEAKRLGINYLVDGAVSTDRRNTLSQTEEVECMQMKQRYGRGFSAVEKTELWDRWHRGESLKAIGRAFGKPSSSIYFQLAPHGGIRLAPRCRSRLALTLWEREEISRGIVARHSIRSMASLLGRSPSTVSREVRRNGGYDRYRAALADDRAWARARRPKRCKLATSSRLRWAVARMLGLNWSPEQIAGWLKRAHPGDGSYQVSHETLYRSLFVQARGVLKKELLQHLRSKRTLRRSKQARRKGVGRGQITDMVSIRERPASVEDRAVPGHWEGDLLSGSKNSYIATLVERHTRYVMLATVANKETQTVVSALITQAKKLPAELYKSLTWDRGKELADHRRFSLATDIDVYFCDPQSPWQRGSNENTNGLLRQYFPKGTDLSVYSRAHLNKVARQLNERPRKTSEFETPAERFNACVASIG